MKERIEESSTSRNDRRINLTKEAIRAVFKKMVCELPYEKITVKGIAERAGINRNTFYLHYDSPDDVLREIQTEHSDRYSALIANCSSKNDVARHWYEIFLNIWKRRMIFLRPLRATAFSTISANVCKTESLQKPTKNFPVCTAITNTNRISFSRF